VRAITPVIWQRRQTEAGDPVNEADTGLPVYYKNQMQQINLRNPKHDFVVFTLPTLIQNP
jgi:hypothetical protein